MTDQASPVYRIVAIPGDGVGPEVLGAGRRGPRRGRRGRRVRDRLDRAPRRRGGDRRLRRGDPPGGRRALRGVATPSSSARSAAQAGTTRSAAVRPEQALFALRGGLGLFANLRPVTVHPALVAVFAAPARAARGRRPADRPRAHRRPLLRRPSDRGDRARGLARRDRHAAVHRGRDRRGSSGSRSSSPRPAPEGHERRQGERPRHVAACGARSPTRSARSYPDVELEHRLVDSCAMQLVRRAGDLRRARDREPVRRHPVRRGGGPRRLARACSRRRRSASAGRPTACYGLYEPIHGSAPDIAGRDLANPIGTILSAAMLLRWSLGRPAAAERSRRPSVDALDDGFRTADLWPVDDAATEASSGSAPAG